MPPTRVQHPTSPLADCQRKHRYGSKKEAKARAKKLSGATVIYSCAYCDGWHIAHRRKPKFSPPPRAEASA